MWTDFPAGDVELVDLSIGLESDAVSEPFPPSIEYRDHADGAERLAAHLREMGFDVEAADFPDGVGLATEELTLIAHTGTHMDAPWHYGPEVAGEPSRTIDEIPLRWCAGEAVVLDFTWKEPRSEISAEEVEAGLDELGHELTPGELVFVETGADELWGTAEYLTEFPGMGAGATEYLVERGIKVIGTDAYGFDKPFVEMGRRFDETRDERELWPAHFAGREVEYCQIEKMANLDALPRRTRIPVAAFPIVIEGGSGSWVRPVAFVEGG